MDVVSVVQKQAQTRGRSNSTAQQAEQATGRPLLTVVTPAYNEADNLPRLYERLSQTLDPLELDWEWIIIDDHSSDRTFMVMESLARQDARVRGFRFARNLGAHTAITCGINHARGNCAVVMAADLQDPPETLPELLAQWQAGAQVVWAVRAQREGETATTIGFSRLYYWLMRRVVGIKEMPPTGADFFLIDRLVIDALSQFKESHTSLMALITWMGFRQTEISYPKQARLHGQSGWSLEKKLKLVVDSVTSFTYLPIRLMSYLGFVVALLGFLYAGWVIVNAMVGRPAYGWSSLMVVVLVIGGIQMIMMGVLGEYLWRALDEARRRPRYIIEAILGGSPSQPGEYHPPFAYELEEVGNVPVVESA
ncbi:MAG: glycosyltransferase family 2 protein [Anaerolineae bacterium]